MESVRNKAAGINTCCIRVVFPISVHRSFSVTSFIVAVLYGVTATFLNLSIKHVLEAMPSLTFAFNRVIIAVNVFKQLELGALVVDPITQELIHSMGTLFVDDTDLYTWKDGLLDPGALWLQTQLELTQWSPLLNATGGALKPEKCFWYMLDYTCKDGEWSYAEMMPRKLFVTNSDGTKTTRR